MGQGLRLTDSSGNIKHGVAAPPYSRGDYTWDANLTLTSDLTVEGDFTFGNATTDTLAVTGLATFTQTAMTQNMKPVEVSANPTDTAAGARQGAINIDLDREATSALATWDGNPDCALKITAKNRAVSGANGGTRGMDVNARCRDSGTESWLNGLLLTVENDGGGIASTTCGEFNVKNTAAVSGDSIGIRIHDQSTVNTTGNHYGLKLTAQYNLTREFALFVDSDLGTWTNGLSFNGNVTNAFDFENSDGTNACTAGTFTNTVVASDPDAYITIDVAGTPYYVPAYSTQPA